MRTRTEKLGGKKLGVFLVVAAILVSWGVSSPVAAELIVIQVQATAGGESASHVWLVPKAFDDEDHMNWEMPGPVTLVGGNGPIAIIDSLVLGLDADPGVSLSFAVTAGATDTDILIPLAYVDFVNPTSLIDPKAYASAAVTLTDINSNGASLTGLYAGGKAYQARYNAAPTVVWDNILDGLSAGVDMSTAGFARKPAAGREQIFGTLSRIEAEFYFRLSANDQASGTSRFDVQPIPEPGTILLLGTAVLGCLGYRLRKRMK